MRRSLRPRRERNHLTQWMFSAMLIVVTVAVLGLGLLLGAVDRLAPLLIFLPAIISGIGSVAQTTVASVWVVVVMGAALYPAGEGAGLDVSAVVFAALFGVGSVVGCRYRITRDQEVHRLRSAGAALQRQLVRPLPLRTPHVVVDGAYEPVEEDSTVGGDMYEVADTDHGTRVMIADVQGKGLHAIGAAIALLGAFREAAHREESLIGVVEALETAVARYNEGERRAGEPERFVTALVLHIDDRPEAEAVNCGHIPPYLIADSRAWQADLGEPELPLGLSGLARRGSRPRASARFLFPRKAKMLLCTDGVTEARAPDGVFYPLEARLRAWARHPPQGLADALLSDLHAFTRADFGDDLAVLTLRRTGSGWR
ncbi:PP2C family protein-serine/threonine phosphatase [Nonomuraea sp. MCN248]|uniref:PP2C family protein-serine/threonine phosphatase n=1 Tax=Nonomuraea corallina TaxID=2989783 RepID=A0ABT4S8H5_9ACTN|nr:PP2C family protein-serine/threonine phosphatase [Nonomuraea corallina]MDA0633532.1 PP2C family protein-serine/threonine phosphatase [Nonomuraea corallina]